MHARQSCLSVFRKSPPQPPKLNVHPATLVKRTRTWWWTECTAKEKQEVLQPQSHGFSYVIVFSFVALSSCWFIWCHLKTVHNNGDLLMSVLISSKPLHFIIIYFYARCVLYWLHFIDHSSIALFTFLVKGMNYTTLWLTTCRCYVDQNSTHIQNVHDEV